ncbi:hypothetical protein PTKIN_Ptkin12aG0075100 [Pterospermum kingtungense]
MDNALKAELLAICCGLVLALFRGLTDLVVKSDSFMAVTEVAKGDRSFCYWGNLISDINGLCRVLNLNSILHVRRNANRCVDVLA